MTQMTFAEELQWRGLIKDKTFADITWLNTPQAFYLGADVGSADSLTIGNLAIFLLARRLLDAGWKTYLLVGGATSLIGDPGGKDSERSLVSREQVEQNKIQIQKQVEHLFANKPFTLVDNYDWFKDVGYLEFLRDVGKHYSMSELIQRDYIAERLGVDGTGISYAEFSYSLIQGYDFWHLFKTEQVCLQIGGSDQWGNMLSGVPLVRKKEGAEVHALSMPLIVNKATGKKFGKSEDGAIWLDEKKTSVYKFYQFWLNADDEGVADYLKVYTMLSPHEINEVLQQFETNRAQRIAQKTLAFEVTRFVHGEERATAVKRISEALFGGASYETLAASDLELLRQELPFVTLQNDSDLIAPLVSTGLAASNGEARRFLQQGGVYVNGKAVGQDTTLSDEQKLPGGYAIIRRGKNQHALIEIK